MSDLATEIAAYLVEDHRFSIRGRGMTPKQIEQSIADTLAATFFEVDDETLVRGIEIAGEILRADLEHKKRSAA